MRAAARRDALDVGRAGGEHRATVQRVDAGDAVRRRHHFDPPGDSRGHPPATQTAENETPHATLPLQKPQTKGILQVVISQTYKEDIRDTSLLAKLSVK